MVRPFRSWARVILRVLARSHLEIALAITSNMHIEWQIVSYNHSKRDNVYHTLVFACKFVNEFAYTISIPFMNIIYLYHEICLYIADFVLGQFAWCISARVGVDGINLLTIISGPREKGVGSTAIERVSRFFCVYVTEAWAMKLKFKKALIRQIVWWWDECEKSLKRIKHSAYSGCANVWVIGHNIVYMAYLWYASDPSSKTPFISFQNSIEPSTTFFVGLILILWIGGLGLFYLRNEQTWQSIPRDELYSRLGCQCVAGVLSLDVANADNAVK